MADPEAGPSEHDPATDADAVEPARAPGSTPAGGEGDVDFADFRPADMARMTREEWEAAFDPATWITGTELLDRTEAELRTRVAEGQLFAVVERHTDDGEPRLLAYTDRDYAVVSPDGTVRGTGSFRDDVEPVVALCSMASYEVSVPPPDAGLPDPASIEPGSGALGHRLLLVIAVVQLVAGVVLTLSPVLIDLGPGAGALTAVLGLGFLFIGLVIGVLVANARLSDRFRAADYRDRLRAAGVGTGERPTFLPTFDGAGSEDGEDDPPS